ncbi:MAG: hypothetical protein NC218_09510 [Acetobacter sp.]|nr:hypothetical protein [Acetobacter sp.]
MPQKPTILVLSTAKEEFTKSKDCMLCGSQRCDRSLEWLEGCPKWKKFLKERGIE